MYTWIAQLPSEAGLRFIAKVSKLSRRHLGFRTERPSQADFIMTICLSFSGFVELKLMLIKL